MKTISIIFLLLALPFLAPAQTNVPAGKVVWWGKDDFWKKYYSDHTNGVIESDNEILSNVVAITGNTWQALLLKNDGMVLGIGNNFRGGNDIPSGLSNVISIAAEGDSYWAIRRDGSVARWGNEQDEGNVVVGLSNIISVTWAGYQNYLALKTNGTVLGFRFDNPRPLVEQVKVGGQILSNVVTLAAFGYTPLVLKSNGMVFNLGYQTPGKSPVPPSYEVHSNVLCEYLGAESARLPYQYTSADPVIIGRQPLSNVVSIASGAGHALALKKGGTVIAWGNDTDGATSVPTGLTNVIAIAAAEHESLALKRDGTVVAWGGDYSHQLSVPAELNNVVAIASGGDFNLALTTGKIPTSVFIQPHGRLEEMEQEADLVFKGQAISDRVITNAVFPDWGKPHATEFSVISVLKGIVHTNIIVFLHITRGPGLWSGPSPPPNYQFEVGQSYLVFAMQSDKADWLYSPSTNDAAKPNEFRQIMRGEIPIRTLDKRPLNDLSTKEAHWLELNLLLNDSSPTNQLYAIDELDAMCLRGDQYEEWRRSGDFKRQRVLTALLPLVTNQNEQVATRAISCFATSSNAVVQLEPFAKALINVANNSLSAIRRLTAIDALSGIDCDAVSNSLAQLLQNTNENIRVGAIGLLPRFQNEFAASALQQHSSDVSPKVRAAVANAISDGKIIALLPILEKLWNDTNNVHTSAGNALLKFDVDQVSNILAVHLNDGSFRESYLCKLAEKNPAPWLTNLVDALKIRRERLWNEAQTSGIKETTNYFHALMALSGTDFNCWNIIHDYLVNLPDSAFAGGKLDWCLDVLEDAGNTGSREPVMLYELYKSKGLNERAAKFRKNNGNCYGFDATIYFDRIDAEKSKQ